MSGRICLSSPPTGLDAYSQKALELPRCVMPLLSPGIDSRARPAFAGQPPLAYPQAAPCGANGLCTVPEYQPDVHRLRRSSSA